MVRLFAVATVAATVAVASASAAQKPAIVIEHSSPLVVRGMGFHAREAVTVTAPFARLRVKSSTTGGFLASFNRGADRCTGGRIVAVGASGDRVVMRLPPMMCLPATTQRTPG
jgi:hypothetical protein